MLAALADTHTVLWYLSDDPRLSATAFAFITAEIGAGNHIGFSAITLVEATYLSEKGRIAGDAVSRIINALDRGDAAWMDIPFDRAAAEVLHLVPRMQVPDMPDRMIAATALHLGVPLITRDANIQGSSVPTIW